ncbi:ABC-type glycerol-3-phosphate transport system substrate-binding protein [Evansella vedderi]|uniref:ABC-type glycerol-3-phosphate transport system substrate-binding protein n=1 Tax=Evansella vedderi TaxID=38282 RepID=A0ABU0A331_9BACI|nr:ABC transporter substrate-binding protein [Evansella vedderi]MDQ0257063.1 ABC-type glycerol-3-phosphate transport system substrate-binding protein [Evansella vedderi]
MKKWFVINISAAIILFGISYSIILLSSERGVEDDRNVQEQIELTFLRNLGNDAFNKAYEELVSAFEATYPHIKINMKSMHWANEYELRLRTELITGNPPDIMAIDSPNLSLYANSGLLLSLDQYMREEGNIEDIPDRILNGMSFNGELFLVPIVESSIALFYNKHLFDEAAIPYPSKNPNNPLTWEEVLEIAKMISNPEQDVYGIDPAQGFGEGEGAAYFKMPILWQFGADIINPNGETADGYLNSKEALEALQFYQDLYQLHQVATPELPPAPLENNQLGMTVLGSWHLSELERDHDFKLGEDFGVAPLPMEKYQVTPNGGWALGISSDTKNPYEAWQFVNFATGFEGSKRFVEITGDLPVRYSVANEFPELQEYPKNIFVQQLQNNSRNRPITPAYPVVSDAIKVLFEEVGKDGRDVEAAANAAVERINTGLRQIKVP